MMVPVDSFSSIKFCNKIRYEHGLGPFSVFFSALVPVVT